MKHNTFQIDQIDGYIFDLDGTIYLGEQALPGVVETIGHLRQHEKKVLFVSNKPLYSRDIFAAQGELALKALRGDIVGIPGHWAFSEEDI